MESEKKEMARIVNREMVRIVDKEEKKAKEDISKTANYTTGITTATPKFLNTEDVTTSPVNCLFTGESNQNYLAHPHGREMTRIVTNDRRTAEGRPQNNQVVNQHDKMIPILSNASGLPKNHFVFSNGLLFYDGVPKTNFYLKIDAIEYIYDNESYCVDRRISLTAFVFENGSEIPHKLTSIARERLEDASIIDKIPFAHHFCEKRAELSDFFYKYVNVVINSFRGPVYKVFARPGWRRELPDYITSDGAIAHPELSVRSDGNFHISDQFSGTLYTEYIRMCATIKAAGKMQVILGYVLANFLHSVFEDAGFPIKHALFIVGPRGCKKTSIAQCFTQLGDDRRTIRFNFQATESGIMFHLQHYADRVMLIDDLAPSMDMTDKRRKEKMLESILRLCGDSGERVVNTAFMKSGADQIDYKVRGGIVITGEYFYGTGSESSIARAVVVSLEKDSVDDALLSYYQNKPQIFESLIFRFLKFVGSNYCLIISIIRSEMEKCRRSANDFHFSNARYVDYLGQYMAVWHILSELFSAEGNVLDRNRAAAEYYSGIIGLLTENEQMMRRQAPVDILISAILAEMNDCQPAKWGTPFSEEVKIVIGEDCIFFRQMDLPGMVYRYAKINHIPVLPLSSTELGKLLEVHGFCTVVFEGGQKRRGKRYKEYGKNRLMSIPIDKLNEFEKNFCY